MDIKEDTVNNTNAVEDKTNVQRGMTVRQRTALLVVGDILVFLIFALVGRNTHGEGEGFVDVIVTAAPFVVAWFLVSPFVGAFKRELRPGKMVIRTALSWLCAWPVAMLLRGLIKGQIPPITFVIVALLVNMALLLIWRWSFALVAKRLAR